LIASIPDILYHYTTESGLLAIMESGVLKPSLDRGNNTDVKYGEGQYFTNISPDIITCESRSQMTSTQLESGQISLRQLAGRIMAGTLTLEKFYCFLELDVSRLKIDRTDEQCIYLHRSNTNLDVSTLIIRSGNTLK
jgi:HYD1 signature containing ADP-ribosyltransferase